MTSPTKIIKNQKAAGTHVRLLRPATRRNDGAVEVRRGKTRLEKSEMIRQALLKAAAEVVGEIGYANATIALITQRAGVGQGTFYNYFSSRQQILDELLPSLGKDMMAHIKKRALGGHNFAELEERSFAGFFAYLHKTPQFLRLLNGAEMFAEVGHKKHFDAVSTQYIHFLRHSLEAGEFPAYHEDELEAIAFMLMAARSYLAMHYVFGEGGEQRELPESVAQTYMKFVLYGLEGVPPAEEKTRPKKTKKA
jgi:AcrR family transcriptional regulator